MIIRTLLENTASHQELAAEHGLSLYVETGWRKILFDMGQSAAFAENAEKMGVDAIGVTYGFGAKDDLKNYPNIALIDDISQIVNYL